MKRLLIISVLALFFVGVFSAPALAVTYSGGHNTIGATSPKSTWYFAEGYTGSGFEEWLTLQNPNSTSATVTITYMFRGGGTQTQHTTIGAKTRETILVNSVVGHNKEVSMKVESNKAIVAERPVYFNYQNKWQGGHNTIGATSPKSTWYFAEGYTGSGFEEWLCLQNPNSAPATATITYMYRGGGTKTTTKTIPANSRETIDVNADAGSNKEVSIKVQSTWPLVAERPMYFDYQSMDYLNRCSGGHNTIGATSTSNSWCFAEGYTDALFDTWLTLQNPSSSSATATITYMFRGGGALTKTKAVAANSRETVYVNHDVGTNKEVSIKVQSTRPLVAERPMYFAIEDFCDGGHDTIGVTSAGNQWYFAEGYTGPGFREWLTLQNPSSSSATATITYMYRGGGTKTTTKTIPANSRETIDVNADAGTNRELSMKVTSTQPITAERPMYFSYQPTGEQGHGIANKQSPQPPGPTVPEAPDWSQVDLITLLPQEDIPGYIRWDEAWSNNVAMVDFAPTSTTQTRVYLLVFAVSRMDTPQMAKDYIENEIKKYYPNDQKNLSIRGSDAYFGTNIYGFAILTWSVDVIVYEIEMLSAKGTPSDLYDDIVTMADYLP